MPHPDRTDFPWMRTMDLDTARNRLSEILTAGPNGIREARVFLCDRGVEAVGQTGQSLDDVIRIASTTPQTRAIRDFAVLLLHALAVDGLLPSRGQAERDTRSFLEHALLNPLRRAGYPFDGPVYEKRRALSRLHTTIDEHFRPPEPTFPAWIQGLGSRQNEG
jgi:hypothetical protein